MEIFGELISQGRLLFRTPVQVHMFVRFFHFLRSKNSLFFYFVFSRSSWKCLIEVFSTRRILSKTPSEKKDDQNNLPQAIGAGIVFPSKKIQNWSKYVNASGVRRREKRGGVYIILQKIKHGRGRVQNFVHYFKRVKTGKKRGEGFAIISNSGNANILPKYFSKMIKSVVE